MRIALAVGLLSTSSACQPRATRPAPPTPGPPPDWYVFQVTADEADADLPLAYVDVRRDEAPSEGARVMLFPFTDEATAHRLEAVESIVIGSSTPAPPVTVHDERLRVRLRPAKTAGFAPGAYGITALVATPAEAIGVQAASAHGMPLRCVANASPPVPLDPAQAVRAGPDDPFCADLALDGATRLRASEYLTFVPGARDRALGSFAGTCVALELVHGATVDRLAGWCRGRDLLGASPREQAESFSHLREGIYSANAGPSLPAAAFRVGDAAYLVVNRFRGPTQDRCLLPLSRTADVAAPAFDRCTAGPELGAF